MKGVAFKKGKPMLVSIRKKKKKRGKKKGGEERSKAEQG